MVGGVVLGAVSIVIPVAHLVLPWALPILGFVLGFYTLSQKGSLSDVAFQCPTCGAAAVVPGGEVEDPMWRKCPSCQEPLALSVAPR